eukprot:2114484-Pyramimonas_sp.AAC.1
MALFALALDPVSRCIRYMGAPRLELELACADDCCFGLQNMITDLMPTLLLLGLLSAAIGLSLNLGKCC